MDSSTRNEIWILGATGRTGRAIASRLMADGRWQPVLVGRDQRSLDEAADNLPGRPRVVLAGSPSEMADAITRGRPVVVVNTLGSYAQTATQIARACMAHGTHYVDLANDLVAVPALLELNDEAVASSSTLITGAGFGVLATEAVVAALCADAPTPASVRVDAVGSVAVAAGLVGEAFAASIVDVLTTGGREIREGTRIKARLGDHLERLTLPDGTTASSAAVPSGELLAAWAASRADNVIVTSALAPTGALARALLPLAGALLSRPAIRQFAVRRLARMKINAAPRPRPHSWGHAVAEWSDGSRREGWLRADDAMDYTADVATAVALRLATTRGPVGAFTPAAAFGPQIAVDAGGTLLLD